MDYRKIFGCNKCSKYFNDECSVKSAFDYNDPSTCPFLCCPLYELNYDLIIPKSGSFYILEVDGVLYTPTFADLETSEYYNLRKCEVYAENELTHLALDMQYPYRMNREKTYVINTGVLMHIDVTHIKK